MIYMPLWAAWTVAAAFGLGLLWILVAAEGWRETIRGLAAIAVIGGVVFLFIWTLASLGYYYNR